MSTTSAQDQSIHCERCNAVIAAEVESEDSRTDLCPRCQAVPIREHPEIARHILQTTPAMWVCGFTLAIIGLLQICCGLLLIGLNSRIPAHITFIVLGTFTFASALNQMFLWFTGKCWQRFSLVPIALFTAPWVLLEPPAPLRAVVIFVWFYLNLSIHGFYMQWAQKLAFNQYPRNSELTEALSSLPQSNLENASQRILALSFICPGLPILALLTLFNTRREFRQKRLGLAFTIALCQAFAFFILPRAFQT